jgi:predicted acyltransferase (DUF342 family)
LSTLVIGTCPGISAGIVTRRVAVGVTSNDVGDTAGSSAAIGRFDAPQTVTTNVTCGRILFLIAATQPECLIGRNQ